MATREAQDGGVAAHSDRFQCVYFDATRGYLWRLIAPNGRERGRSAHHYPQLAECMAAIAALRLRVARAEVVTKRREEDHSVVWALSVDGVLIAVSPIGYQRTVDLNESVRQFREAATVALVDPTVTTPGRRSSAGSRARTKRPAIPEDAGWSVHHIDNNEDDEFAGSQ